MRFTERAMLRKRLTNLKFLTDAKLPIDPNFAACVDKGEIEFLDVSALNNIAEAIEKI